MRGSERESGAVNPMNDGACNDNMSFESIFNEMFRAHDTSFWSLRFPRATPLAWLACAVLCWPTGLSS